MNFVATTVLLLALSTSRQGVSTQHLSSGVHISLGPPCPLDWNPSPCECTGYSGAPNIDCSAAVNSQQLVSIFHSLPEGMPFIVFRMHDTNVTFLSSGIFGPSVNFTTFIISKCNLSSVADDFFATSKNAAESIKVSETTLEKFPFNSLSNFSRLEMLAVAESKLSELPSDMFDPLGLPRLQELDLHGNQIKSIAPNAFSKLPYMMQLDLSGNSLNSLGPRALSMKGSREIVSVNLASNSISQIDKEAFEDLPFSILNMERNKLEVLDEQVFGPLLEYMVRTDSALHLEGNPISCNSTLRWLVEKPSLHKQHIRGISCPNGKTLDTLEAKDLTETLATSE